MLQSAPALFPAGVGFGPERVVFGRQFRNVRTLDEQCFKSVVVQRATGFLSGPVTR